jgi:hypothetical protein
MADNNFRANRSRDDVELTAGDLGDNPLADLARLIGQRDRGNEFDRGAQYNGSVQTLEHPAPAAEQGWTEDERYAAPPQHYAEDSNVQPRLPDYPADDRGYAEYDDVRAPAPAQGYAEPADTYAETRGYAQADGQAFNGQAQALEPHYRDDDVRDDDDQYGDDPHDETRSHGQRYAEQAEPPRAVARQLPGQAPPEQYDEQWDEESDLPEEYEEDTPKRRNGLAIILAILGLVLIGAAGAYAYRAMFGGAMLMPSLPPIIKPADGPNKIVPPAPSNAANPAGGANPSAPAQLVPREEQPVPVQPPPAPPKVLSTIPVAPSAPPAAPGATAPNVFGAPPQPAGPAPAPAPPSPRATAPSQPQGTGTEPKKVHTVPIRPDQMGDASAAAPTSVAPAPAPAPRTKVEPAPRSAPAPHGPNAPLSLVPGGQSSAPAIEAPRTRMAHTEPSAPAAPTPAPAPAAGPSTGGYAVQVSSQRSEAEAHAAFRELQAKYPAQLGSRQPIIHRADLGDKGTYYRAMVGPFGSAEAAASLCSSIKAAGGSCIVQKN